MPIRWHPACLLLNPVPPRGGVRRKALTTSSMGGWCQCRSVEVLAGTLLRTLLATEVVHKGEYIHFGGVWRCRSSQEGETTSIPTMVLIDHPMLTRSATFRMVHYSWMPMAPLVLANLCGKRAILVSAESCEAISVWCWHYFGARQYHKQAFCQRQKVYEAVD